MQNLQAAVVSLDALTQSQPALQQTAAPESPRELAREVDKLPSCHTLYSAGDYVVLVSQRQLIPRVMNEIGRLREVSFRAVAEGTGKDRDLDVFDDWYLHVFVWQRSLSQVLGAYRLAMTDVVRRQRGAAGLYTTSLFDYDASFLDEMGPAVELGRSFVRPEAQGGRVLALLWRGIGHLLAARPRYRTLFGPVSVSSAYSEPSRQLIAAQLCQGPYRHPLLGRVAARRPLPGAGSVLSVVDEDVRVLSKRVSRLESDQKGLPILVREYIKLGGQFLAFSVDPAFQNAMDGLVVVDLNRTRPRLLALHMGQENYDKFRRHGQVAERPARPWQKSGDSHPSRVIHEENPGSGPTADGQASVGSGCAAPSVSCRGGFEPIWNS
jgi:putative hemolysin